MAIYSKWLIAFSFIFSIVSVFPITANAGLFSFVSDLFSGGSAKYQAVSNNDFNSQNVPLLQNTTNFDTLAAKGGDDIIVVNNEALMAESGPSGTLADIPDAANTGQISKYMVRRGDTLSSIAKMFGVSANTIIWANDLSSRTLQEGQILVILPVSGTIHTVKSGDTLKSIAKKYKADIDEIVAFNNLDSSTTLAEGTQIIIPDGEGQSNASIVASSPAHPTLYQIKHGAKERYLGGSGPEYPGYYIRPLVGGIKTQGLHGWNGIDIGTPIGTPILAAASGEIIVARPAGWNGGYGKYIVISHYNGTQTVYGHLSQLFVSDGEQVVQGQVIGLSGNTGNSTGPHLHFEVRGAVNPLGP